MNKIYAHSNDRGQYELLSDHLNEVAEMAAKFADDFGHADVAERAGYHHDYGKAQVAFQKRVRGANIKCDHSTAGAKLAYEEKDIIVAFCVAGHHAGLADMLPEKYGNAQASLGDRIDRYKLGFAYDLTQFSVPPSRNWLEYDSTKLYNLSFLTRMVFSCLVDADFLCTERFMEEEAVTRAGYDTLVQLNEKLDEFTREWDDPKKKLHEIRNNVRYACNRRALEQLGLFSLTVPTGGGKTIASLSFAIKHAICNGLERVIYVIPYTSIIDQTVEIFQKIFGKKNVVAHHSEIDYSALHSDADSEIDVVNNLAMRHQLATENWDAPIIVTTSVQFFESFHAARPSKTRKLHNVAKSVVIFDEVQSLPRSYLRACVEVIDSLVSECNTTALLCTATQPALDVILQQISSKKSITEIIENKELLFKKMKRVNYQYDGDIDFDDLGCMLNQKSQVLCIVNTKKTARDLYLSLGSDPEANFYLSTWMTPVHRKTVISEIKDRLANNLKCRVISTSLIEAGVDLDFPVVYREVTRLDSIIQAGGRCNREGELGGSKATVHVFRFSDRKVPRGLQGDVDRMLKVSAKNEIDNLETIQAFFQQFYYEMGPEAIDQYKIVEKMEDFCFQQVQKDFVMIPDSGYTIYIQCDENRKEIEKLIKGEISRDLMRKLGNHSVTVYKQDFEELANEHAIELVHHLNDTAILVRQEAYDQRYGLKFSDIEQELQIF